MFYRKESDHLEADEVVTSREFRLRLLQLGLLLVFVVSFYHLATGQLPWSRRVMERIAEVAPQIQNPKAMVMLPAWFRSDIDHPGVLTIKEHTVIGLWWGAAFAAAISAVLLLTAALWLPRSQKEGDERLELDEQEDENAGDTGLAKLVSSGPIFYLFLAAAIVVGGWLRAPLLDHSLGDEEAYAMRHFAHGSWQPDKQGGNVFQPVPWQQTLFENSQASNHLLNSLVTRLSLDIWRSSAKKATPAEFSEAALRMPALIAGVLAIGLIGFLGWEIGLPWMGIGAAWLLALHPWHLRYSGDGQGYALMIFFASLSLLGLVRGLKHNHLSAWQMFAVGEVGCLLSFPASIYAVIAVNVLAFVELVVRRQPNRLIALIAFNLLAALPIVVWALPSVPQAAGFMARETVAPSPHGDWLHDLAAHVAAGVPLTNNQPDDHLGTSWGQMMTANHTVTAVLAWGLGLLMVLGLIAALIESRSARVVIWGTALGAVLAWWHAGSHLPPPSSLCYLLIPAVLAIGLASVRIQLWPALVVILIVGFFGMATETPRHTFIQHDRQPIKETVAAIREKRADALTGTFGVSDLLARSYDPQVRLLSSPADVAQLLAQGEKQGSPVLIYFCGVDETTHAHPDLVKRVAAANDFQIFKQFKGLEANYSYRIFAWTGGPP